MNPLRAVLASLHSGYTVLHRVRGAEQGQYPPAERPLLESGDGFLYGVAGGGTNRAGIIFKLNKSGGGYQIIHQFQGVDGTGDSPIGGLVEWCDGALYGTTKGGGIVGENVTFKGPEEYVRSQGVRVDVLQNEECIRMMREFIAENPTLWNEDIGV
jgi:hypothetical protein